MSGNVRAMFDVITRKYFNVYGYHQYKKYFAMSQAGLIQIQYDMLL